jgi:ABC-2 type transport system ATP-binding protein
MTLAAHRSARWPRSAQRQSSADHDSAIVTEGLTMAYGRTPVLRGIDLEVHRGEVFALLGPNGAGKTTTVEILEGFRTRSGGRVEVLGADPAEAPRSWRERLGVVLQSGSLEPDLDVIETLELYAGLYSAPRPVEELLELTGLVEQRHTRNRRLSGGQQRRLDVALALVGDPELLFLDEPTTGFDPAARRAAWVTIDRLRALGKTIFLTTHYLEEAEELADRIAVVVGGQIVAEGTPATLGDRHLRASQINFNVPAGVAVPDLPRDLATRIEVVAGRCRLETPDPTATLGELTGWALAGGWRLEHLEVRCPTLEDIYLELTQDLSEGTAS